MKKRFFVGVQHFADIDAVVTEHATEFGEGDSTAETFKGLSERLGKLGYDVIINNKAAAEFVPSSRLSEVVAQREQFKTAAETANKLIEGLQKGGTLDADSQAKLDKLVADNLQLVAQLAESNLNADIISLAKDAIDPKDVLQFVNRSAIKADKDGKVISGAEEEVERIRSEKPYLWPASSDGKKGGKGGSDPNGAGNKGGGAPDMNSAIRSMAGKL
jgi:hypothetical protein